MGNLFSVFLYKWQEKRLARPVLFFPALVFTPWVDFRVAEERIFKEPRPLQLAK